MDMQWIQGNDIYDLKAGSKVTVIVKDAKGTQIDVDFLVAGIREEIGKEENKDLVNKIYGLGNIATGPLSEFMLSGSFILGYYFRQLVDKNKLTVEISGPFPIDEGAFDELIMHRLKELEDGSLQQVKAQFEMFKKVASIAGYNDEKKA